MDDEWLLASAYVLYLYLLYWLHIMEDVLRNVKKIIQSKR